MHVPRRLFALVLTSSMTPVAPALAQAELPSKEAIDVIWLAMATALVFSCKPDLPS